MILYIWGPNGDRWYSNNPTTTVDTVVFKAPETGTYQIEVHGYTDAEYSLNFGTTVAREASFHAGEKPLPDVAAVPLDSWPEFYDLDTPPVTDSGVYTLFLPTIVR